MVCCRFFHKNYQNKLKFWKPRIEGSFDFYFIYKIQNQNFWDFETFQKTGTKDSFILN
jgi:hypothetical protein